MVFGLLIDWISSHYHQEIWTGIQDECRFRGVNLLTLVTGRPGSPFRWEQMRNQLLEFLDGRHFDGFLFMTSTLGNHLDREQFRQLLARVAPAPVVSIGAELEGCPSVLVDNRTGFHQILRHLRDAHGYRRFAWAGGSLTNQDSRERRSLLIDFLRDEGLEVRDDWLLDGTFSNAWGRQAVHLLVPGGKPEFDVLVCGSDEIAMGALEGFSQKNLHVPGDVALTGFDDVQSSGQAALTTARQPLAGLGRRAASLLWDAVTDQEASRVVRVATSVTIRQTCGCLSPAAREAAVEPRAEYLEDFWHLVLARRNRLIDELTGDGLPRAHAEQLLGCFLEAWNAQESRPFLHGLQRVLNEMEKEGLPPGQLHFPLSVLRRWVLQATEPATRRAFTETTIHRARILLSEALHNLSVQKETHQALLKDLLSQLNERLVYSRNFADQAQILLDLFPRLGIHRFRLSLYEDPIHPMNLVRLVLTEEGEVPDGGQVYDPRLLFAPGSLPGEEPWSYVAEALFDRNAPLGFFLLEARGSSEMLTVFDQLCERVGRGVETVRRIQDLEDQVAARTEELRDALEDLEAYNVQLKELALRDELTGLYNRRGFLTVAEHQLKALYRRGPASTLFFGDLDGLKTVNDTWGHDAGDEAIRTAARLLTETFRAQDVVARLGGDEFVILAPECSADDAQALAARLASKVPVATGGRFGLSLGWIAVDPRTRRPLIEWMKEADEALYHEKEAKRIRRASPPPPFST